MSKYTPAPWKWDGDDLWHYGEDYNHATDPHQYTGIKSDTHLRESKTLEANRALIAAAPELLEACKSMLAYIEMKMAHTGAQSVAEIMACLEDVPHRIAEVSTAHHLGCLKTTRRVNLDAVRAALKKAGAQ